MPFLAFFQGRTRMYICTKDDHHKNMHTCHFEGQD